jgi:hypothetical protein
MTSRGLHGVVNEESDLEISIPISMKKVLIFIQCQYFMHVLIVLKNNTDKKCHETGIFTAKITDKGNYYKFYLIVVTFSSFL